MDPRYSREHHESVTSTVDVSSFSWPISILIYESYTQTRTRTHTRYYIVSTKYIFTLDPSFRDRWTGGANVSYPDMIFFMSEYTMQDIERIQGRSESNRAERWQLFCIVEGRLHLGD